MSEAAIDAFIAVAVTVAITIAIQFGERAHRYKRLEEKRPAGTYGYKYETAAET